MSLTMNQARQVVLDHFPTADIVSVIEYQGKYLFIATRPDDELEGHLDPFLSVEKESGFFRDFSPQDYDKPLEVLNLLEEAAVD